MGANVPDVRVRLSAEGELSIINAFKKIQAEADKTGRIGARGLSALTGAASTLGRLLPSLTFAGAIAGAVVLAKRSLEAGDNFAKLSQRTGISVETLSAYAHGADLAGVDSETLAKGLAKLSRAMQAAAVGGEEQLQAFRRVGITQKELQSGTITLEQALGRIAGHLANQADGWQKSAEAQIFFGRSGDRLLPFLNQGPAALDEVAAAARRLGLVWSTEDALAAEQFNDNLKRLRGTVDGFVHRELAAFLPLLVELSQKWLDFTAGLTQGDSLLKNAAINLLTFGAAARFTLKALTATTLLGPAGFVLSLTTFRKDLEAELAAIAQTVIDAESAANKVPAKRKKPTGGEPPLIDEAARGKALDAAKKLADAALALTRAELDSELALVKAHNAAIRAEEQDRFKAGLTGIEQYFAELRAMFESEAAKEIAILEKEQEEILKRIHVAAFRPLKQKEPAAEREAEVLKLRTDLAKVQTETEVRRIALTGQQAQLAGEERDATRQFNAERLTIEAQLAEAQGRRFAAERLELEAQIAGMKRLAGEASEAFDQRRAAFREAGELRIEFGKVQLQAQRAFADLENRRISIETLVERGVITQLEGQQQIALMERERLPGLQAIAAAMRAAAVTPEQIEAARQLTNELTQLAASSDLVGQRMAGLKQAIQDALTSDLANFFARGIDDAKSFGDAMRGLALSVVQSLREIAAQMLATLIISRLLRSVLAFASGGAGIPAGGTAIAGAGMAGGGLVRGPGTGTSDSIPAWLSTGEYMMPAARVREGDNLAILEAMRAARYMAGLELRPIGRVRGYAQGGLVHGEISGPAAERSRLQAEFDLNDALVLKRLAASSDFDRIIVRTLEKNRRSVNAALRR